VSSLRLSAHTGTHVDARRHFFGDGAGANALPLALLSGQTRVLEVTSRHIGPDELSQVELAGDVRLLIKTHNSQLWGSPEFDPGYVGVTETGAEHLVEHSIKVVGVDCCSVEEFKKPGAPAHHVLLGGGTIVIEGLNLRHVEPGIYEMFCLPLRIVDADGSPARVVLGRS
jgi:arylformamidase